MIVIPSVDLVIPDDIVSTSVPASIIPQENIANEMRYQMFAPISNQITASDLGITVEIKPTERWNAIMLFNVGADTLTATILNGPAYSVTRDLLYSDPLTPELLNAPSVYLETPDVDPVLHPDATLKIELSATGRTTFCETFAVGWRQVIGTACYGTEISIVDYSRKDRDVFGNVTLIERGYSDRVTFRFVLETDTIGAVREFLASRRAKPTGYLGVSDDLATYVFGLYQDFTIPIEVFTLSNANITVDSVVRTGVVDTSLATTLNAAFVDPDAACITETLGTFATIMLDADGELNGQRVRVAVPLGRAPLEGEMIEWLVDWSEPNANLGEPLVSEICGTWFATWDWPVGTVEAMTSSTASIQLRYTTLDPVVTLSNAVTLTVRDVSQIPCTAEDYSAAWFNPETDAYDQTDVVGLVGLADIGALATIYDDVYYRANNPDVVANAADWLTPYGTLYPHYWGPGDIENRKPNAYFDPAYYKAQNPDVVAAIPEFFYNSLQHYQMFGYGEGRLPSAETSLFDIRTIPIGDFYWIAKAQATDCFSACAVGCCDVTWEQSWSGTEDVPYVTIVGDTVTVTAQVLEGLSVLAPVSTGVLTMTATVTCDGGDPVTLDPITLTLGRFSAGWHNISTGTYTLQAETGVLSELPDRWTARINGDLTGCTAAWEWEWSGSTPPAVNTTGPLLAVSGATQAGVLTVSPSVECETEVTEISAISLDIFPAPTGALTYSERTFVEATANDGSISTISIITLTHETFTGADNADWSALVSNVPAGLTASLIRTGATSATMELTGRAVLHAESNGIRNLTVTFADDHFAGNSAASISGSTTDNLVIDFADPPGTLWGIGWSGHTIESGADVFATGELNALDFVQVGTDADWVQVSLGGYHVLALKADGTMWAWGNNDYGQCGTGVATIQAIPYKTQIGIGRSWRKVFAFNSGMSFAVDTDGSLWAWGRNHEGHLGIGSDVSTRLNPTLVAVGNWTDVSTGRYTMGINNGEVYSWVEMGQNTIGLGYNVKTSSEYWVPQRIPCHAYNAALRKWITVPCGGGFHSIAKVSAYFNGALRDGALCAPYDNYLRSFFVQRVSPTGLRQISTYYSNFAALTLSGQLVRFGDARLQSPPMTAMDDGPFSSFGRSVPDAERLLTLLKADQSFWWVGQTPLGVVATPTLAHAGKWTSLTSFGDLASTTAMGIRLDADVPVD